MSDDLRAKIADAERANRVLRDEFEQMRERAVVAEAENKEHEASLDIRWKSDMRAIERWRAGRADRELVWPDHADLCVNLLDWVEAAEAKAAAAQTDTARLDWMIADIIDRKVYVRDYDEETGKYTFICKGHRAETPRAAIDAARVAPAGREEERA
jgi:hypothetical protein